MELQLAQKLTRMHSVVNKGFIGFVYDGHDGYFRVQVGAFELKENADRYLEKVKAAGFSSAYVRVK